MGNNNVTYINHHKIEYFDESHTYYVDGKVVPSVSTLVERASQIYSWDDYSNVSQDVLENAAKKGTILHKIIENYEKYRIEPFEGFIDEFNNYLLIKEKYGINCKQNERIVLFCDDHNKPIYCGRLDMVISRDYKTGICDLKRTSKLYDKKVSFQLNLYCLAYMQSYNWDVDFLSCIRLYNDKSEYVEFEVNIGMTLGLLKNVVIEFEKKYKVEYIKNNGSKTQLYEITNDKIIKYNGNEEEVVLPDYVKIIGKEAFSFCKMKKLTIPSNVYKIQEKAFWDCEYLKYICFEGIVKDIGKEAFFGCESLENIIIPNGARSIGKDVFSLCDSLKSVQIPNSIKKFEGTLFDCKDLVSNVFENGLYLGNDENPYLILNSIKMGEYKFFSVNENTRFINTCALADCYSIKSIMLNKSVEFIGEEAFNECRGLKKVYYFGNEARKNKIRILPHNKCLLSAKWFYFTKNGPNEKKSGNWWYYDDDESTIIEMII